MTRDGYAPATVAIQRPRPFPERADVELFIPGVAVPKGSMKGLVVGRGPRAFCKLYHDNDADQRQWRGQILAALDLSQQTPAQPWHETVAIGAVFVLPRVASLPKRWAVEHTSKPDVDKLTRCLLDAFTGVLYGDDSAGVMTYVEKRYAAVGEPPGVHLRVAFLPKRATPP